MEKEYLYKIIHKPTGLFYGVKKGRFKDEFTNLSKVGKFYGSEKVASKVLERDCQRACVNKAQVERYNLNTNEKNRWSYSRALVKEFEILKYEVVLVK